MSDVQPVTPSGRQRGKNLRSTGGKVLRADTWEELIYLTFEGRFFVRLQRFTAAGVPDVGWPLEGLPVAEGFWRENSYVVHAWTLARVTDGGCVLVTSGHSDGCHDGLCGSGGAFGFTRVSATGDVLANGQVEPYCALAESHMPLSAAVSDRGIGLFSVVDSPCTGQTRLRHVVSGGEPGVQLTVPMLPHELARVADGTLVAKGQGVGGGPMLFHWNPDGTPSSGSPTEGVLLPAASFSDIAIEQDGSTIHVWRPLEAPAELWAIGRGADGSTSPGWPPTGRVLVGAPGIAAGPLTARSDGSAGAYVAWADARDPATGHDIYASHLLADGSIQAGLPANGYAVCDAPGSQTSPRVLALAPGVAVVAWQDDWSGTGADIYAQRLLGDTPVPATASLERAAARPDRVSLEWRVSEAVPELVLERSRDASKWSELARLVPGSLGRVTYEDTDVRPGEALAHRIHFQSGERQVWTVPVWVEVPRAELAIRVLLAATRDRLSLEVTLASDEPAQLELLDVKGRRLQSHDVSRLGTSPMRLELGLGDLASGIAWLRLRQGNHMRTLRLSIMR